MKQIDLGGMSFAEIREKDKYYVDKTLLIKDLLELDNRGVYLFTRPRRFGKTCNLSMLDAFFNIKFKGNTWFDGLAISKYPEFEKYKNAYPVIRIDLGNANADAYERYLGGVRRSLSICFEPHRYLLEKDEVRADLKRLFESLDEGNTPISDLIGSIQILSRDLMYEFGVKPIILIDEYDRGVTNAFGEDSHKPMMEFLREFMYTSIKGNPYRGMVYVTGVMQIAKQSIFSGLNNIVVNNVFSVDSDERFGFTELELKKALKDFGYEDKFDIAKKWYNGYHFGNADVYNPFSIMYFIRQGCEENAYWVDSGSDVLIRDLLKSITTEKYTEITKLITGGTIRSKLKTAFPYEIIKRSGKPLYSLMVMTGYLNAVLTDKKDILGNTLFELSIPNEEVRVLIRRLITDYYPIEMYDFTQFNKGILNEEANAMEESLSRILSADSYLNLKENTYQAVVMTLVHALSNKYRVKVDDPDGQGRVEILLTPKTRGDPFLIMELKVAKNKNDLNACVEDAFKQIHDRRYYNGMGGRVILVGIAFWNKVPKVRIDSVINGNVQ